MTGRRTWVRRVATVGVVLTVAGVAGAGSASASSSTAATQGDLLGLNALVGGVTAALTGSQATSGGDDSATRPAGKSISTTAAVTEGTGLAGTVEKLPLVGPLLGSVVADLGLGETEKPAPVVAPQPAKPAKPAVAPAPAKDKGTTDRAVTPVRKPQMSPTGSTWTAPRVGTVDEPASSPLGGVAESAADVVRSVSALLPETTAGKAGVGAAAVALIVLGGVAVAGAAGAAGAAGRRGLVGGAW
jgi:hypothetical protein